jgi:hypothetical protein
MLVLRRIGSAAPICGKHTPGSGEYELAEPYPSQEGSGVDVILIT